MARQPRTAGPKEKFAPPSLRDLMSVQQLSTARRAADIHDRHIQNALIAASQRARSSSVNEAAVVPIGGPDLRPRDVRMTSGLSGTDRRAEGLEGV